MEAVSSLLQGERPRPEPAGERQAAAAAPGEPPWELIMDKKHFKLWRRPIEGTHLYQYRGNGRPPAAGNSPFVSWPRG